jgi:hypothetical protein
MFARVSDYSCDPGKIDQIEARMPDIKAGVKAIAGVVDVYSVWGADGKGVTFAIYESQAAAEAAQEQIQAVWANLADCLTAAPAVRTFDSVEHITG